MAMVRDTVQLNDTERELFATLLAATRHAQAKTVMRCAGGWVRDKLLGKDSVDIDIALDDMLGKDFAQLVNQYLQSQGQETRAPAVIQSNPDQSKHLETARMKLCGLWVDLVNLRSETYAADSRIPTMAFGTAEQDAVRRDFTINSLFYNINTGAVEDLTGRGLQDLRAGIIRTPLPPQETFLDDPLRVLRAVRFATRFGFELEADILTAASSEPVRTALGHKVSKERIGTELEGMFHGQAPVAAVELLLRLSLLPVVFALPAQAAQRAGEQWGAAGLACMRAVADLVATRGVQLELEDRRVLLLAALLLPLRLLQAPGGPKGKPQPVAQHVVRESIKWRAKDADTSVLLHEAAPSLLDVYRQVSTSGVGAASGGVSVAVPDGIKVELGNAIRRLKQHWKLGVLLAPVLATRAARPLGVDPASPAGSGDGAGGSGLPELADEAQEAARSAEVVGTLLAVTEAWGLTDCWQWKPLLDGKRAMAALGLQKPGPELGRAMAVAVDWQLVHPSGTADECEAHLKQWFQAQGKQQ